MITLIKYSKNGFCSFCGSDKPANALQYKSTTHESIIPICNSCYSDLTSKGEKKSTSSTIKTKRTTKKEKEVTE